MPSSRRKIELSAARHAIAEIRLAPNTATAKF
jgi:hypothetical protein